MPQLVAFFFGALLLSLVAFGAVGLHLVAPWNLIVLLAVTVPFAYGVSLGASGLERSIGTSNYGASLCGVLAGFVVLWAYQPEHQIFLAVDLILFSALGARLLGGPRDGFATALLLGLLALGMSPVAISYLNYVALVAVTNRMRDPVVQALDLQMYRAIYGRTIEYSGIFPLVSSRAAFDAFERAYIILFAETMVVVFALVEDIPRLRCYLLRMFACYVMGLAVFVAWPVAGPFLYYPESFRPGYEATMTASWMRSSYLEFSAIRGHLQPITGFGSFIGLPSLHTAMALLCQLSLRRSPMLFWIFFPINALTIASTVVLGYHYALDVLAGVAVVATIMVLTRDRGRRVLLWGRRGTST